jgi:U2 small nuclear ribonucleoprotein A'
MRITVELLSQAEQRTNPIADRELVLRDLGIPMIENLGAARDDFDSYDLSNNRISRLENFPKLHRLARLHCAGNLIEAIDGRNLKKNVPNLVTLNLSHNNVSSLAEVANLGTACDKLEFLSLVGNPVTSKLSFVFIECGFIQYNF